MGLEGTKADTRFRRLEHNPRAASLEAEPCPWFREIARGQNPCLFLFFFVPYNQNTKLFDLNIAECGGSTRDLATTNCAGKRRESGAFVLRVLALICEQGPMVAQGLLSHYVQIADLFFCFPLCLRVNMKRKMKLITDLFSDESFFLIYKRCIFDILLMTNKDTSTTEKVLPRIFLQRRTKNKAIKINTERRSINRHELTDACQWTILAHLGKMEVHLVTLKLLM